MVLDANGEATVFIDQILTYKFVLTDANDVQQWTVDNVGPDDTVSTAHIIDGAVTTPKIADGAITPAKLASSADTDGDRAVTTNHIRNTSVTGVKLNADVADDVSLQLNSSVLSVKDSGISTAKIADGSVTQVKMASRPTGTTVAAGGVAVSGSSGTHVNPLNDGAFRPITNQSVTITTTGRPVHIFMQGMGSDQDGAYLPGGSSDMVRLVRDGSPIKYSWAPSGGSLSAIGAIQFLDVVPAGTYTYEIQMASSGSGAQVWGAQTVAYEI